ARVFLAGNFPCHTFIWCLPPGLRSFPHGKWNPVLPPRAANSHSASVGSRVSLQSQKARASFQETCTTGWSSRPCRLDPGPSGCCQSAPSTRHHHGAAGTRCLPVRIRSGNNPSKTNDQPKRSASVTYPVSSTNCRNRALVTAQGSIRNGERVTV